MLKRIFSRHPAQVHTGGWIVEVTVPVVGTKEPMQRLFAVGAAEGSQAELLMQRALGNLHCTVVARVKLTPRALACLDVVEGSVQEIDAN
jgi:hypothetical protein